jgi:hypothetical protein
MAMTMRTVMKVKRSRTIKQFTCQTVARLPGQVITNTKGK